ncbi:hypothetical protein [Cryptosporangium arvum]|uniref:Thiol-disulfide isomerase-like thioredoxin n=1 Tax=Cryptosporangium arvum DSM 44712 TaxID=927661 RepID=A0A010YRI2_9ACTN|nr:hypothetical protein [Cryptosporangium arvum]EXG82800.1 thiol-disulfide isomerase-like thioredoxin [Cryptosporangium arvum DSM 44712]
MAVLVAAVVVVGAVALANLVFTFGVVRRLREHTELLNRLGEGGLSGRNLLGPGRQAGPYTATAVDGTRVSGDGPDSPTLVGFFSLGCEPCTVKRPLFADAAREHPGGRDRVLAVVVGDDGDGDVSAYLDELTPVSRVVRELPTGELPTAFRVDAYPAFALVDADGTVLASGSAVPDATAIGTQV